jgi:hypothetical protein
MSHEELRRGDRVEVRSAAEILATLDAEGTLAGLPFMPEMVPLCGRRFTVMARAEKICDTIDHTGSRRLPASVLLDDLRCDGSGHDGCQAECRLLWKEAWLKRVTPDESEAPEAGTASEEDSAALLERASQNTRRIGGRVGAEEPARYRCQATDLNRCTVRLRTLDPRPYVRELTSGNVSFGRFVRVTARAAIDEPMRKLGLVSEVHPAGTAKEGERFPELDLKVGERVRIRSPEEIARTLGPDGRNRGLRFDREMLALCGRVFRVRSRIRRFISDSDGKMIVLKTDAVTLDGAVCSGDLSMRRWFCPRAIRAYWRECWLERVDPAVPTIPATPAPAAEGEHAPDGIFV